MIATRLAMFGTLAAALLASSAVSAQVSDDIVKIGVLTDMNGPASTPTGQGSVTAAQMAVDDFGGTVLGKPVTVIVGDHQLKPDIGATIARRWYDIPLRAALVASLVGTVVTASTWVGPRVTGVIALFPIVFSSMMLILHPRIGGPATAAVLANSAWGLLGFGLGIAVLNVAVLQFGSAVGLCCALATCIAWNLVLWRIGRRKQAQKA